MTVPVTQVAPVVTIGILRSTHFEHTSSAEYEIQSTISPTVQAEEPAFG